jgi:monoterpene epsilon-lactone hydrolase
MVSLRGRLFYAAMKLFFRGLLPTGLSLETYHKISNQPFFEPMPRGIGWTVGSVAGVPGEWITPSTPDSAANGVLLYLHGGGYVLKTPRVHRVLVGRLAKAAGVTAFMPDYRLAPEHPFPAALEDVTAVYRELVRTKSPADIIIAGDSGGGGLAAALLLNLRDSGDPLPAAVCLISAMLDCTFVDAALAETQKPDPFLRLPDVAMMAKSYYGDHDPREPLISPVFADFHGLPPLLVHASQDEILRPEAIRYAECAKSAGVDATLKIWEGMIHAFPLFAGFIPEGKTAIHEIGAFFRSHLTREVV